MIVVSLLAGTSSCGADEQVERARVKAAEARSEQPAQKLRVVKDAQKLLGRCPWLVDACTGQMDPLLGKVKDLGSRLDIGLTYAGYSDKVADLKAAYDDTDFKGAGEKSVTCLAEVEVPPEKALNLHVNRVPDLERLHRGHGLR